jgi:SP family xylose:H+ symportor-like MFS transporter
MEAPTPATAELFLAQSLTLTAAVGGLLFGYDTAVISGAVSSIDANFIDPLCLSETMRNSLSGLTISSALFGCVIGGAIAGPISSTPGRRVGLIFSAILFLISSLGAAVPEIGLGRIGSMGPDALLPFNVYRILGGIGVGLASMLSPLYIAEIAPKAMRGRLVSYNQMAIVIGIVLVYFINWAIARQGNEEWIKSEGWRWMFASEAVPALLFLLLLLRVPDSPRWLVMKGRPQQALDLLVRLSGREEGQASFAEIKGSFDVPSQRLLAFGGRVLLVGIMLSVFQQLVGINAVLYYAPVMFRNMGATTDSAFLQTVLVGSVNLIATLVAIFTVDRLGRKPLMVIGAIIMAASMVTLGILFQLRLVGLGTLITILVYIAGFAMSWGPVTWVLLSELFPNSIKGTAMAIAVAMQWVANLLVTWSFKILDGNSFLTAHFHHGFAYLAYGVLSALAALFVVRFVPETKGESLEAIQALWVRPETRIH